MPAARKNTKAIAGREPIEGESTSSRALTTLDQELNQELANLRNQVGQSSGNKLTVKPSGAFELPDGTNLGDEIRVVVVDFATHHDFYEGMYNPQNPAPPICYARGKDLSQLAPEADSPDIQNDKCSTCPQNQFGSGQNGKSKACKNSRALAVLIVDDEGSHNEPDAPMYLLKLPPTAIKSFDGMMNQVARTIGHPVKATVAITAENVGTYAQITFVDPEPNRDYAIHANRRGEAADMLYRKPDFAAFEARQTQAKPAARGRAAPARGARR